MGRSLSFFLIIMVSTAMAGRCITPILDNSHAFRSISELDYEDLRKVGFELPLARRWIEKKQASSHRRDLLAASAALSRIFIDAPTPALLIPRGALKNEYLKERRIRIGRYDLILLEQKPKWSSLWFAKLRPAWAEDSSVFSKSDLNTLFGWISAHVPDTRQWWVAAQAIRAGLFEEDPHSELIPLRTQQRRRLRQGGMLRTVTGDELRQLQRELAQTQPLSPSVTWDLVRSEVGSVGWIRIANFLDVGVVALLSEALHACRMAKGIILDLRGNPGGKLDAGVEVASLFMGAKPRVLSMVPIRRPHQHKVMATSLAQQSDLPLVVLIDHTTASSAEIVAGILQVASRAVIVGTPSHGKGSVQDYDDMRITPGPLHGLPLIIRRTSHLYAFANGSSPQKTGVMPDYLFPDPPEWQRARSFYPNEFPNLFSSMEPDKKERDPRVTKCLKKRRRQRDKGSFCYGKTPDPKLFFAADVLHCLIDA